MKERKTFTFDGENSADYGLYISGDSVYNAPNREIDMISIPGRNGQLAIDMGRYENITVTYPAFVFADTQEEFREKIRRIRNWLCSKTSYQRLTDEYNPESFRLGLYKSGLEVEPIFYNRCGEFEMSFDCKPQRFLFTGEEVFTLGEWGETETYSGSIVSFEGTETTAIKTLNANIVPKQSGSGDPSPSNIRSISGTDTVKISRMGNGLFFPTQSVSQTVNGIAIVSSGGAFHIYGTATSQAISNIFSVNPLTFPSDSAYKVYLGNTVDDSNVEVSFMNGATRIDYWVCAGVNRDISMPQSAMSGQTCDGLRFKIASGAIVDLYVAPYIAKAGDIEETSISLGQTVYGGTLEAIEGNGTKTYWYKEFVGDEPSVQGLGDYWGWVGDSIVTPWGEGTSPQDGVCSHFKYGVDTLTGVNASSGYYFLIKKSALPSISTLEEFKSWVASQRTNGTPLTVCYKLATPRETFSTTPTEVKTLLGNNNIFADSGDVTVEYRADTTLAYNELLSLIASLS